MVDASVGGKTGVDLPQGKNLVGAFKQLFGDKEKPHSERVKEMFEAMEVGALTLEKVADAAYALLDAIRDVGTEVMDLHGAQELLNENFDALADAADEVEFYIRAGYDYVPGEVLVKFKDGVGVGQKLEAFGELDASKVRTFHRIGTDHWKLTDGTVAEAIAKLEADPRVELAQPNYVLYALEILLLEYVTRRAPALPLGNPYSS